MLFPDFWLLLVAMPLDSPPACSAAMLLLLLHHIQVIS